MGSAITLEHLKALRNALPADGTIIMVLDGDTAGVRAVERACQSVFLDFESEERTSAVNIKVASLPPSVKDPADYVLVSVCIGFSGHATLET